ncbi:MAG: hypothetical protein HGA33_00690 [Candidatus Moranbacteria bacterium]|nr:hypothetical protein [Candidatus Moranbacteria bacterium]
MKYFFGKELIPQEEKETDPLSSKECRDNALGGVSWAPSFYKKGLISFDTPMQALIFAEGCFLHMVDVGGITVPQRDGLTVASERVCIKSFDATSVLGRFVGQEIKKCLPWIQRFLSEPDCKTILDWLNTQDCGLRRKTRNIMHSIPDKTAGVIRRMKFAIELATGDDPAYEIASGVINHLCEGSAAIITAKFPGTMGWMPAEIAAGRFRAEANEDLLQMIEKI